MVYNRGADNWYAGQKFYIAASCDTMFRNAASVGKWLRFFGISLAHYTFGTSSTLWVNSFPTSFLVGATEIGLAGACMKLDATDNIAPDCVGTGNARTHHFLGKVK